MAINTQNTPKTSHEKPKKVNPLSWLCNVIRKECSLFLEEHNIQMKFWRKKRKLFYGWMTLVTMISLLKSKDEKDKEFLDYFWENITFTLKWEDIVSMFEANPEFTTWLLEGKLSTKPVSFFISIYKASDSKPELKQYCLKRILTSDEINEDYIVFLWEIFKKPSLEQQQKPEKEVKSNVKLGADKQIDQLLEWLDELAEEQKLQQEIKNAQDKIREDFLDLTDLEWDFDPEEVIEKPEITIEKIPEFSDIKYGSFTETEREQIIELWFNIRWKTWRELINNGKPTVMWIFYKIIKNEENYELVLKKLSSTESTPLKTLFKSILTKWVFNNDFLIKLFVEAKDPDVQTFIAAKLIKDLGVIKRPFDEKVEILTLAGQSIQNSATFERLFLWYISEVLLSESINVLDKTHLLYNSFCTISSAVLTLIEEQTDYNEMLEWKMVVEKWTFKFKLEYRKYNKWTVKWAIRKWSDYIFELKNKYKRDKKDEWNKSMREWFKQTRKTSTSGRSRGNVIDIKTWENRAA